jgi:sugar phosphate isomerase/epimerase
MRTLVGMEHPEKTGRPRLLAATGPLLLSPLDWVMDAVADAGYDGVEVLLAHNPETRDPETILAYARQAGLQVPVLHGPYMLLLRNVLGADYIDKTRRSLQIAAQTGAHILVAHPPYRWERLARWWTTNEADAEAADLGVTFAMENLFPVRGIAFSCAITPNQLAPFTHLVFDTSHFAVAGIDVFHAWEALRDRVVHLHVSDNLGTGTDSHAPIGTGILPLKQFLAHVGSCGWSGTITLELDCRAHLDSRDTLVAFLTRERRKAQRLLAGDFQPTSP